MPKREDIKRVLVIGSGPIIIGQAAEFDYSGSQACRSLREEEVEAILVNSNPATIMTDEDIADKIYIEPLTPEVVAEIIRKERPDGLLPTMGGQTGLNIAVKLERMGVLEETGCRVIGTPIESIITAEDRDLFFKLMDDIGEPKPESRKASSVDEALSAAEEFGYPVIVRPGYCLGGTGSGIAYNREELPAVARKALEASMNGEVSIDQCVLGWKEIEYEVMRDGADNCITVCNMENLDPMGIHTGESIVVAPAQTLTDREHQTLRSAALRIIRALGIEGACNIQFAVCPERFRYYVIEVNPRASRSSALASKATGYPIARVAAKIALGMTLGEIKNRVTGKTLACFEPALDYTVVKIPRWPFDKFGGVDKTIGTRMKSTGEVMAIGRTFEEALQKVIRSLDIGRYGLGDEGAHEPVRDRERLAELLRRPTDGRIFHIRDALVAGMSVDEINRLTGIDKWFLNKIRNIVETERRLRRSRSRGVLAEAKRLGFSDVHIANLWGTSEGSVRKLRRRWGILPVFKMVDTCAAEFEAITPYYYSTYEDENESASSERRKVVILGSGPIRIGQGAEFDYCTVHSVLALRELGIETIVINNNPETVSTDFDMSDKLYFEPLTFEDVMNVIELEHPDGVFVQFGGQTAVNLVEGLSKENVRILGTPPQMIDAAEDRGKFREILKKLGIAQAPSGVGRTISGARKVASKIGYPVLVRPSYVLGGRAMEIVYDEEEFDMYIRDAIRISRDHPVLVDKFLYPALEVDVDAVSDGERVLIGGIMEHIEHAGIHSGDSACVVPPQILGEGILERIKEITRKLARELKVIGLINIQCAIKDGTVYVLEANPRASRTVPFISKATGIPLAKLAARAMVGVKLPFDGMAEPKAIAVKEAVFPFAKLPGVDPELGPEMKSTGEVMGVGSTFSEAFHKAQLAAGNALPRGGSVFISVRKEDRDAIVPIAKGLKEFGFTISATDGTAKILRRAGVEASEIVKVSEGRPNVVDYMKSGRIQLVINTPGRSKSEKRDGYIIRRACVELGVPYVTTIAAARASLEAIEKAGESIVKSMDEWLS